MTIAAVMISYPGRNDVRSETLEHFAKTDWGELPHVQMNELAGDSLTCIINNAEAALTWFIKETASQVCLFLEDDTTFNVHLRWNLEHWAPLFNESFSLGTLYTLSQPGREFTDWPEPDGNDYYTVPVVFGAQGLLLSRDFVDHALHQWGAIEGRAHDVRLSNINKARGGIVYYHRPDLIDHRPVPSSWWGGNFHKAKDFDPDWMAKDATNCISGS